MLGWTHTQGGAGQSWRLGVAATCLAALAAGCGATAPSGPGDGGAGGAPGWHLFFPLDQRDGHVLTTAEYSGGAVPLRSWTPGPGDPWLADLTDRTLVVKATMSDGQADLDLVLARSGDTVSLDGSATVGVSPMSRQIVSGYGGLAGATWCYRPKTSARSVRFTATMNVKTLTVAGQDAEAFAEIANWGDGGGCRAEKVVHVGRAMDDPAPCTSAQVDLSVYDGEACLDGDSVGARLVWGGHAGSVDNPAPDDSASIEVAFTVKATALP